MNQIEYKDVKQNGTFMVSYPNDFDIDNIRIYVEDRNGHHATFLLNINTDFGQYLKNYFDPIPVSVRVKMHENIANNRFHIDSASLCE